MTSDPGLGPFTRAVKPNGPALRRDAEMKPPEAEIETTEAEVERVKGRLAVALTLPLATLAILVGLVLIVDLLLVSTRRLSEAIPPALAIATATIIIVIAVSGVLQRDTRLSFRQVMVAAIGSGTVLAGVTIGVFVAGGGGETVEGPGGTVDVIAEEDFQFNATSWSVDQGEVTFLYQNASSSAHTLTIEGREDDFLLRVSEQGQVDSGSIPLKPGEYTVFCSIRGHRDLGMEGTLTVEAAPKPVDQ